MLDHAKALWVTSWPEYHRTEWRGAWFCTVFRNEGAGRSSDLIREAVAATRALLGDPPELGMVTFVNADKVRHKRDPGRCFLKAGFKRVGLTKVNKLIVLQLLPADMPPPEMPFGTMAELL